MFCLLLKQPLLIVLNLLTILMSTLMLHLGFFGRLLALYKRNFLRVEFLTKTLTRLGANHVDEWWNCRNFVLNDDLALDYDIGGLAVSLTFILNLAVFFVLVMQIYEYGFSAILTPPGSYCAYACLYLTMCLIKIFTLATSTFEEQHAHIATLRDLSQALLRGIQLKGDGIDTSNTASNTVLHVNQSHTYTQGTSGGNFHPVVGNEYTVDDYGAYYELSPRHSGAVALGGLGESSSGGNEDPTGGDTSHTGSSGVLKRDNSYSLYGYGDEYGEIYAGLSPEQREEERARDAAYEQEKKGIDFAESKSDHLLDMFRKNDIHVNVTPGKDENEGGNTEATCSRVDDGSEVGVVGNTITTSAAKDYAALMALGVTGEKKGVPVGSQHPEATGIKYPWWYNFRKEDYSQEYS